MRLLPSEREEAIKNAKARFEAEGEFNIFEPCDCGSHIRHNNRGNYHDETFRHIYKVQEFMMSIASEIEIRGKRHDESKLNEPEASAFAEITPKLKASTYWSNEYKEFLKQLGPALKHHYENNQHHPEHWKNGVNDMNLVDLIEMFCDWLAATKRHNDGDIFKSIELNQKRFGISDQLCQIFRNTARSIFNETDNNALEMDGQ